MVKTDFADAATNADESTLDDNDEAADDTDDTEEA